MGVWDGGMTTTGVSPEGLDDNSRGVREGRRTTTGESGMHGWMTTKGASPGWLDYNNREESGRFG